MNAVPLRKQYQLSEMKTLIALIFTMCFCGCVHKHKEVSPNYVKNSDVWTTHYSDHESEEDFKERTDAITLDDHYKLYIKSFEWHVNELSFVSAFVKRNEAPSKDEIDCSDIIYRELVDENQRFGKSKAIENILTKFFSGSPIRMNNLQRLSSSRKRKLLISELGL